MCCPDACSAAPDGLPVRALPHLVSRAVQDNQPHLQGLVLLFAINLLCQSSCRASHHRGRHTTKSSEGSNWFRSRGCKPNTKSTQRKNLCKHTRLRSAVRAVREYARSLHSQRSVAAGITQVHLQNTGCSLHFLQQDLALCIARSLQCMHRTALPNACRSRCVTICEMNQ